MHISRTNPEPTKTKLIIKAELKELKKAKELALKHLAPQVKVPGFRQGHVPPNVLEKNVDPNTLQSEVIEHTINTLYASAIRQEKLRPVTNPQIAIKKFVPFTELEFEAEVPVISDIKLSDYKKVRLDKPQVKVTTGDINNVIKSLQARVAERNEVKRAAKLGDEVIIDFKGTDSKGKPVSGADAKDYPLILGSNSFIPGFETEITGLKASDTKKFKISFPGDYAVKSLQNQKVDFEVKINKVTEVVEPKVDDNFATAIGPFKSVKELKDDIKKQLQIEKDRETDVAYENDLLNKIAEETKVEIPSVLVDEQIDRIEQDEKQNLAYRGQTWEEHLKEEGVTPEEHREQKREAATQRVKIGIILSEVAENEKITALDEEIQNRINQMKQQYQDPSAQAELNKPEAYRDIDTRIRTEKTLQLLKSFASKKN